MAALYNKVKKIVDTSEEKDKTLDGVKEEMKKQIDLLKESKSVVSTLLDLLINAETLLVEENIDDIFGVKDMKNSASTLLKKYEKWEKDLS